MRIPLTHHSSSPPPPPPPPPPPHPPPHPAPPPITTAGHLVDMVIFCFINRRAINCGTGRVIVVVVVVVPGLTLPF